MYNNPMFPRTPDSFTEKVKQVVQENMKTTVSTTGDEVLNLKAVHKKKKMEEDSMKNVVNTEHDMTKTAKQSGRKYGWQKKAVAAAIALAVVGAGGFTVRAVVNNMVKERMESMQKEEKKDLVSEVDSSQVSASTYSRELTKEEKERQRELTIAYQKEGRFPEGKLKRIENESEVDMDTLCFLPETSYFYLPERALTDEELLQMIDYSEKVNYALRERYEEEYSEEVAAQKAATSETKQKIETKGGISEEEAVVKAQEWLNKLYGKTGEDMELAHGIDTVVVGTEESPCYAIRYTIAGFEETSIFVDAASGTILQILYFGEELDADAMSISDAENKVDSLSQTAEKYLRDTFGIAGDCKEVYYAYDKNETEDTVRLNMMTFRFIMEDGMTYRITLDCQSEVLEVYDMQSYDAYQKALESDDELREMGVTTYETVRKQLK